MVNRVSLIPLAPDTNSRDQSGKRASAELFSPQFFLGPENRLLSVVLAATSHDRTHYSPVVLHGPSGLGKSHFVNGLATRYRQTHPKSKTVALTGRDFARAYASAVELDSVKDFRVKYRQVDFFALDGIEPLANKPSAQLELLHTLDALDRRGGWFFATASTPIAQIATLHSGLRSRLSGGLDVPLAYLSAVTRRAVVEDLARQNQLPVTHRLVEVLSGEKHEHAVPLRTVPELRRAFQRLANHSILVGESLDTAAIIDELWRGSSGEKPTLRQITRQVAKHFRLKASELTGLSRRQGIVHARGVAIYVCRQITGTSYEELGRYFGGRDHTTVLHAYHRIAQQLVADPDTRHAVHSLTERLAASLPGDQ